MKHLGIDYGTKRIGLATSDDEGKIAFPNKVIENSPNIVEEISTLVKDEAIGVIIIGESKNFQMKDNPIMEEVRKFADRLSEKTGITIEFFPELFTSAQVSTEHHFAQTPREQNIQGEKKPENLDAKAAALMLQGYLDTKNSGRFG